MVSMSAYEGLSTEVTAKTTDLSLSTNEMFEILSVRTIIQMDVDVLPLLFQSLVDDKNGCNWRMAVINRILKNNILPRVEIPKEFRGVVEEMVYIYIRYGQRYNYIK